MKQQKAFRHFSIFTGLLALVVLSCSGATGISNLFATDTPTPTNTFTPSPTLTPSPTSTATETPSPTPTPLPTGITVEEQPDGGTLLIDYDNHYQLVLPLNWEIVFSSQKELQQTIQSAANQDPRLAEMAESFKGADPDEFRLAAMNVDLKYMEANAPTLLTVNAVEDSIASSMPMAFVTAMIEDSILQDATSTTWDVTASEDDTEVGLVEGTRMFDVPNGTRLATHELVIAFQANQRLILIEIVAPEEYQEEIKASFLNTFDSIKVKKE